jgi:hypothetical protein
MFSYVVWFLEICTNWTQQSIVTQTNCRAAQKVRKRVKVSLDIIVQRLSLMMLHESFSGAGRISISKHQR